MEKRKGSQDTAMIFRDCSSLNQIRYSQKGAEIFKELPEQNGWYQDGKGPYTIEALPTVPDGKTALLTRQGEPAVSKLSMYRMYNPNSGEHFYTASSKEKNDLIKAGWRYEGIGWYSDDNKSVSLYRLYNPNAVAGAHHYTTSAKERDNLKKVGWRDEGLAWYGMK